MKLNLEKILHIRNNMVMLERAMSDGKSPFYEDLVQNNKLMSFLCGVICDNQNLLVSVADCEYTI